LRAHPCLFLCKSINILLSSGHPHYVHLCYCVTVDLPSHQEICTCSMSIRIREILTFFCISKFEKHFWIGIGSKDQNTK
jgi:hypothetical protein